MSDSGVYEKIDPAALLLAVLAVGVPPLITSGAWGPISTVIALVIGAIVFCFTWPHPPQTSKPEDLWIITAQSLVFGLVASVAFAWPAQSIVALGNSYPLSDCVLAVTESCGEEIVEQRYDTLGTWIGFLLGAVVAAVFWFRLRAAAQRLARTPPATGAS